MANVIYTVPLAEEATIAGIALVAENLNAAGPANVYIGGGTANYALLTDGTGNLRWGNSISGSGTVTSVATSGTGLGFTLTGGPITTTGTVTLTVPSSTTLRTNLTIGNVANINLNSNISTFLAGNGAWLVPTGTYSNSNVASYLPTYTGNLSPGNITVTGIANITGNLTAGNANIANILISNVANVVTLNVSGNANVTSNISVGGIKTDNFYYANGIVIPLAVINGNNSEVFFNNNGNSKLGADPAFSFNNVTKQLTLYGNIFAYNANLGNATTSNYFIGAGNNLSNIRGANVNGQVANSLVAETVYANYQPNINQVGTLINLGVTGNINSNGIVSGVVASFTGNTGSLSQVLVNAGEKVTISATGATGTIDFNIATQSVIYRTGNATSNWGINFVTNDIIPANTSVTVAFLATIGATGYFANSHTIDGSSVTPKWQSNSPPTLGDANSIDAYTYSIIRDSSNTYTVLAAITQYK